MPYWLTYTLLAGLAIVFISMPFHAFVSTWGGTAIGPLWLWKSWKEVVLVGLLIMSVTWVVLSPARLRQLFSQHFVWAFIVYVVISMMVTWLHKSTLSTETVLAGLAMNFRYLVAGVVAYLVFRFSDLSDVWLQRAGVYVLVVGVFLAVLGILQALVVPADFLSNFGYEKGVTIAPYTLVDDNPELLRAFATLRGPNDFGAFLILPLLLAVAYFKKKPWLAGVSSGLIVWALLLSSSRSAWLGVLAALGVAGLLISGKYISKKQLIVSFVGVFVAGVIALYAAVAVPALRMAIFHSSPGDSSLTEGSTDDHVAATVGGIDRVVDDPIGCGVGCAGPASYYGNEPRISESYIVQIAEEVGVVGFIAFAILIVLIARQLLQARRQPALAKTLFAALCGYAVIGLLLHVWADDPLTITWWTLAGAILGYNSRNSWKKSKDNSLLKT